MFLKSVDKSWELARTFSFLVTSYGTPLLELHFFSCMPFDHQLQIGTFER